jgi:hypothetical protein
VRVDSPSFNLASCLALRTAALKAGVSDHLWSIAEIIGLLGD